MSSTHQEHEAWTAAGSDVAAKNTYASIKKALEDVQRRRDLDIFLQGSYANSTNIRADSDVDVVVMTRQTFQGSADRLTGTARAAFDALPMATFSASDLRQEVLGALLAYYGASRVHRRNKCLKVDRRDGYVDADVVPCLQYRWYPCNSTVNYVEGITILPVNGGRIVNFPKRHIENGQQKNAACSGNYKKTVRQVKRLRNRAIAEGRLADGVASGYLLECLVYNVPSAQFVSDDSERVSKIVLWLKYTDKSTFMSCDGIHELFRTDPGMFSIPTAQSIIDVLWDAYY